MANVKKKKLFNKGKRNIHYNGGILSPNKAVQLKADEADKLLKLFKAELIDMDNVSEESLTSVSTEDTANEAAQKFEAELKAKIAAKVEEKKKAALAEAKEAGLSEEEAQELVNGETTDSDAEATEEEAKETKAKA